MMTHRIGRQAGLWLLVAALLGGCETSFEIDVPAHEPRLVLNGLFAADGPLGVSVTRSRPLDEGGYFEPVEAFAAFYEDGLLVDTASTRSGGAWSASVQPRPGHTYRVRVTAPGFAPAEATDVLPGVPRATLSTRQLTAEARGGGLYEITVHLDDPAGEANYYALSFHHRQYVDGRWTGSYGSSSFRSSDPVLRDGSLDDILVDAGLSSYDLAYFSDRAIDGKTYDLRIREGMSPSPFQQPGEQVVFFVRLRAISEAYYRYMKAAALEGDDSPFTEPVALPSNVEGGFGLFAGYSEVWLEAAAFTGGAAAE